MAVTKCVELAQQQRKEARHDTDSDDYTSDSDEVSGRAVV